MLLSRSDPRVSPSSSNASQLSSDLQTFSPARPNPLGYKTTVLPVECNSVSHISALDLGYTYSGHSSPFFHQMLLLNVCHRHPPETVPPMLESSQHMIFEPPENNGQPSSMTSLIIFLLCCHLSTRMALDCFLSWACVSLSLHFPTVFLDVPRRVSPACASLQHYPFANRHRTNDFPTPHMSHFLPVPLRY
jgi:hypothetical protein